MGGSGHLPLSGVQEHEFQNKYNGNGNDTGVKIDQRPDNALITA